MPHSVAATDHLQANTGMSAHLHLISILHFQVESQWVTHNAAPSSPAILCEVATARLDYAYDHQTTFTKTFASFFAIRATFCCPLLSACGMCSPSICLPGTRRYQQNRSATQTILCEPVPPQSMLHPRCSPRMYVS